MTKTTTTSTTTTSRHRACFDEGKMYAMMIRWMRCWWKILADRCFTRHLCRYDMCLHPVHTLWCCSTPNSRYIDTRLCECECWCAREYEPHRINIVEHSSWLLLARILNRSWCEEHHQNEYFRMPTDDNNDDSIIIFLRYSYPSRTTREMLKMFHVEMIMCQRS